VLQLLRMGRLSALVRGLTVYRGWEMNLRGGRCSIMQELQYCGLTTELD
jgi:hypothetical protein